MSTLTDWTDAVRVALDIEHEVDEGLVLDVARDVAHGVARPAAPLTAYLLGLAVAAGADPRQAAALVAEMAAGWKDRTSEPAPPPEDPSSA